MQEQLNLLLAEQLYGQQADIDEPGERDAVLEHHIGLPYVLQLPVAYTKEQTEGAYVAPKGFLLDLILREVRRAATHFGDSMNKIKRNNLLCRKIYNLNLLYATNGHLVQLAAHLQLGLIAHLIVLLQR